MQHKLIRGLIIVSACLAACPTRAQTCTIGAVTLNFGAYDPNDPAPTLTTGAITYQCAASVPVVIKLHDDATPGPAGDQMRSGNATLHYQLFRDANRTIPWGDGLNGTTAYTGAAAPSGTPQTIPVFGELAPGQRQARAGTYSESIVIEISART